MYEGIWYSNAFFLASFRLVPLAAAASKSAIRQNVLAPCFWKYAIFYTTIFVPKLTFCAVGIIP